MDSYRISGYVVDIIQRKIFPGSVEVSNGKIISIIPQHQVPNQYILPGFIDAHIHIESSMLIPSEFARLAVLQGTVATVSDPHEIANVLGIEGVRYMIENGAKVPFHFYFGVPSCVPATPFETSGAVLDVQKIRDLFLKDKLKYLSEMMNYPGVLNRDPLVMEKICAALELGLPVDGHAPGLKGSEAERYISAGITTDHECVSLDEALDKIKYGMKILIREGSAAKNYEALHTLIKLHPDKVMFCSDDKHPHELVKGHINELVKRSINEHGYDVMDVLRCASYNPINHYKLDVGYLKVGQSADFIVVNNLHDFQLKQTFIKGKLVAENGKTNIRSVTSIILNKFNTEFKHIQEFIVQAHGKNIQVIEAIQGELITNKLQVVGKVSEGQFVSDSDRDILKIAVVNRYSNAPIALAFVKGFGLKRGAIASCIAHDSHNIIAVGVNDDDLCLAVNKVIENKGGISVVDEGEASSLELPVAGIMSHLDAYEIANQYAEIDGKSKKLGTCLEAPFMTLSFMALLVIPSLKLSDKGLFDGDNFEFTSLSIEKKFKALN